MDSNKKVLVTGGCGYIGSHVTRQLSELGYQVVVYDNLSTGNKKALIHGEKLVVADLADTETLRNVIKENDFSAVLHFAASIVVPESVSQPLEYYRNNTVHTLNLLEACRDFGLKDIIFSSTAAVYGESGGNKPISEDDPLLPTNPYARSKLMDEWILADLALSNPELSYVVLRYFNVAGADLLARMGQSFPNATHLIKVASEVALGARPQLMVYGDDYETPDGTCVRDYIHIEDLADAHVKALQYLEKGGESRILNCGYGVGYSVKEVVAEVDRVHGTDVPRQMTERRPGDVASLVADSSRLQRELGWKPQYNELNLIVKSAYEWEKKVQENNA